MKNLLISAVILICVWLSSCNDKEPDLFEIITTPVWLTDSLIANGVDAGGPGQLLEKFKGEALFKKDGTGNFGKYTGTWWFTENRTQIIIKTDSLALPLTNKIIELNESALKITTAVPDKNNPTAEVKIRMTFKSK